MSVVLSVEQLSMRFGGLLAIEDVTFAVERGRITALIGPNGAGKTTVFNCITGFYQPTAGRILLHRADEVLDLQRMPGFRIARVGVARTFQNIRLFPSMSVLENLLVAQHNTLMRASLYTVGGLIGWRGFRRAELAAVGLARDWLERVGLVDRANEPAGSLPYGAQRRLEIVRALCTHPQLLCLDEPAAGLNPRESAELGELLRSLRDQDGLSILLIEHDMSVVMNISDHIVVLDYGRKIAAGTPVEVRANAAVIRAYLGEPEEPAISAASESHGAA